MKKNPRALEDIKTYVRNLVLWLAPAALWCADSFTENNGSKASPFQGEFLCDTIVGVGFST
jgi:hypothetical protein